MDCCELVTFVSTLSCVIANCVDEDQLEILGAIFTQLGDSLVTLSTCRGICDKNNENSSNPRT